MFGLGNSEFLLVAIGIALMAIVVGFGMGIVRVLFNAIFGQPSENKQ